MNRWLTLAILACWTVPCGAQELRVGAASTVITPPKGARMAGYYHTREADGVHDDLHSKAIVLESGDAKAALVALDLISAPRGLVERSRDAIEAVVGIPAEHVMISATHAHTGPVLRDPSKRTAAMGGSSDIASQYMEGLPERIAESVRLAHEARVPAQASAAIGRAEGIAFNRRFHMKDGSVGWNPGRLNPNIVRPVGPVDASVPVVYLESTEKKPLATYANFAMHLDTVGGLEISADYPYTLSRLLGEYKGSTMVTLFTIGTAGDVNHIHVGWSDRQKGHAEAMRLGTTLAGAVLNAYTALEPVPARGLRARCETILLPLAELDPGAEEKARATIERRGGSNPPSFLETVEAYKVLDVLDRGGKPLEAEVQVIALGSDVAWVALPGEIFVELGLAIKKASPFEYTIVAELANGNVGYVPTQQAWPQGNYEVVSARCGRGSGERLVEAAVRLLLELHTTAVR